jgi:hypothetical protein
MRSLLVVLAVVAGACGSSSSARVADAPVSPKKQPLPGFLANIPDDVPYIVTSLEGLPPGYYAKIFDTFGPVFTDEMDKQATTDQDTAKFMAAIRHEVGPVWSAARLEALGLSASARFAIYGAGKSIILRVEVRDQNVMLATLRRIATSWGKPFPPPQTRAGISFWRVDDKVAMVVAFVDNQLVAALGTPTQIDSELDVLLGIRKPPHSLADGTTLTRVMAKHHLGPYLVGIVDTKRMIDLLVSTTKPLPADCVAQLGIASRLAPRIVFGHTPAGPRQFSGGIIVELSADAASELRDLHAAVPGLTTLMRDNPLFAFGGGLDLAAARKLTRRSAAAIGALATACDATPLRSAEDLLDRAVANWVPAPFDALTGFAFSVHELAMKPGQKVPERLQSIGLVSSTDAPALFHTLVMALPMIGSLGIDLDGAIHEFGRGLTPFGLFAGVSEHMIIVATGDKDGVLAERVITEKADVDVPLFTMSYDYGRLVELTQMLGLPSKHEALEREFAKMFGRSTLTLDVGDDGLVLWSTIGLN